MYIIFSRLKTSNTYNIVMNATNPEILFGGWNIFNIFVYILI